MRKGALLAASLVLTGLPAIAAPALAQGKAAIQKLEDQWAAAFNKGDAAAVAAMYAEDAYVLPAGGAMVRGRDAIAAFWGQAMEQMSEVKCSALDVRPLGRSGAREIGTCAFKTKGQAPQPGEIKYAVVWRRVNGQWLLDTDIWNGNK